MITLDNLTLFKNIYREGQEVGPLRGGLSTTRRTSSPASATPSVTPHLPLAGGGGQPGHLTVRGQRRYFDVHHYLEGGRDGGVGSQERAGGRAGL